VELLSLIVGGFQTAITPENVLFCLFGVVLGTFGVVLGQHHLHMRIKVAMSAGLQRQAAALEA
jgi:TctA family transporter